ncbi:MAG TPA: ATP-dependent helicase HrpB, partial [Pseudoxanthomonas sp.]|nr:ATP-dependent helicase HrpB [Pseudoxanthomonas sp.]
MPIHTILADIRQVLATGDELVLEAPPGAGKTTLVPLALLDQPWLQGRILLLEPRRMAARAAAQRMADLLGEKVGVTVGYRIRQESRVTECTRIEVVTGGVLIRLLQDDPALSPYSLLIFDEFHERSLDSDLGLALALQGRELLRDSSDPLKILVMSATLDGAAIATLLGGAPLLRSEGRAFPVALHFADMSLRFSDDAAGPRPLPDLIHATCHTVMRALMKHAGSILVFLPGQREILSLQTELQSALASAQTEGVQIAPLYGSLSLAEQQTAIHPVQAPYQRKVVLATDIAETSLTIEGVNIVVDTGLHRSPQFDPRAGLTRLQTGRISQASAAQRAGRAGRQGPGVCYRLWREDEVLAPFAKPEILQADLAPVALQMLAFGVADPHTLTWLTPPPAGAFDQALDLLQSLNAITRSDDHCLLTPHGRAMAAFPAHPRLAHMM